MPKGNLILSEMSDYKRLSFTYKYQRVSGFVQEVRLNIEKTLKLEPKGDLLLVKKSDNPDISFNL